MKKILIFSIMMLGLHLGLQAATVILTGSLGTIELTTDNCYILRGCAVVENGDTLTINPGVEIRCESGSSLTIEQGGKIYSNGNSTAPVVFTSDQAMGNRAPGDWVGITLNGYAKNNVIDMGGGTITVDRCSSYIGGGMTDSDNSGSITYTRIEFAGQAVTGYSYTDALVLNGIGSATVIEGVQITQSAGNGLSLLGGKVNVDKVYVLDAHKHGLHISDGYTGYMQSLLVQTKDDAAHDAGGTHALYLQNNFTANNHSPLTEPNISNATLMGPLYCDPEANVSSDFGSGVYFNNYGGANIYNSVITGFREYGLYIADEASAERTLDSTFNASNNTFLTNGTNYGHGAFTWNISTMCESSMERWIDGIVILGCEEVGNQFDIPNLAYNASFCTDFCGIEFDPNFVIDGLNTELASPDYVGLAGFEELEFRGAIQDADWISAWASYCPDNAGYCDMVLKLNNTLAYSLQLVPNPARNATSIQFEADAAGVVTIYVMDKVTGRIYLEKAVMIQAKGKQSITLPANTLQEGVYTIKLVTKTRVMHAQLLIQR
jgi:hypothetical protein